MNVLIVDDQPSVISALKSGVRWNTLNVTQIFTALNAFDAKRIIKQHQIDILLSDIEMPVENGLSLLRWCRENHYDCECVFLTAHADFFYAQEAIQLGSTDYILQPARYEDVENVIRKVISRISEKQKASNYFSVGKALTSQKPTIVKNILKSWFTGQTANNSENLNILQGIGVDLLPDSSVLLMRLQLLSWKDEPVSFSEWAAGMEQEISEFFSVSHYTALSYFPDTVTQNVLLYSNQGSELRTPGKYKEQLEAVLAVLEEQFGGSYAIYATPSITVSQIEQGVQCIQELAANNVMQAPGVYLYQPYSGKAVDMSYNAAFFESIQLKLASYQTKAVLDDISAYFSNACNKKQLTHRALLEFCRDFEQAAISAAIILGLNIHEFPTRQKEFSLESYLPLSLSSAMQFVKNITDYFDSSKNALNGNDTYLQKISNYIRQNLDKPIKCSEVAQAVYLSRSYINQLVQREKGISLKEYITLEKMTSAQQLLRNTTLSISTIASKVGYDNFSHFSQVYKRVMGVAPSEERR